MQVKLLLFSFLSSISFTSIYSQSPIERLNQLFQLYNENKITELSSVLEQYNYNLTSNIPAFSANEQKYGNKLVYTNSLIGFEKCSVDENCSSNGYREIRVENQITFNKVTSPSRELGLLPNELSLAIDTVIEEQFKGTNIDELMKYHNGYTENIVGLIPWFKAGLLKELSGINGEKSELIEIEFIENYPSNIIDFHLSENEKNIKESIHRELLKSSECIAFGKNYLEYVKSNLFYLINLGTCNHLFPNKEYFISEAKVRSVNYSVGSDNSSKENSSLTTNIKYINNKYNIKNQIKIELIKENGVYKMPVKINGKVEVNFIFDSGASIMLISPSLVEILFQSGTLSNEDFIKEMKVEYADGSIDNLKTYNLRSVEIDGLKFENVECAVGLTSKTSFLLGQNLMEKFGKYEIDYNENLLILNN